MTFFSFLLPPLFEFLRHFPGLPTVHMGFAPSSSHHWEAARTAEVARCSCSHWTWESASPSNDAPQCDEGCKGRHWRATCGYRQFVRLHYHKLCGSTAGVRGQCGFQLKLPIEDGFMFGLFQNTLGCNLSFKLSSWKHFPFLVQRV